MKNIELTNLTLTNYRNIEYATYKFDGDSFIVGENKIGKTNTLEAIMWLLTDKLLNGSNDIASLKPLQDTSKEVVAKATFLIDSKEIVTLKKEFKEKWVKARGTTDIVMQGHTTTYYFNDVKQGTLRDYNNNVCEAFGLDYKGKAKIEIERLLVDPFYLGDLGETKDWTALRSLIIELVGDVQDDEVFNKEPTLLNIKDTLKSTNGKVDEAKKKVQQEIVGLKEQIIGLESNIKFASETEKPSDDQIAIAKKAISEHETNIARLRANNGVDEISNGIQKEIIDIKDKLIKEKEKALETSKNNPSNIKRQELQNELNQLTNERTEKSRSLFDLDFKIKEGNRKVESCNSKRLDLIDKLKKIDNDIANVSNGVDKVCPLCGREYDEATMQEHIEKITAKLESDKQDLINQGKQNNLDKQSAISEVRTLEANYQSIEQEQTTITNKISKLNNEISELDNITSNAILIKTDKEQELENLLTEKELELKKSQQDYLLGRQDINSKIYDEQELIKPYEKTLADLHYYERKQEEIEKLNQELHKKRTQLANAEQNKDLLAKFIKTKLEMLDENVEEVFGSIKFQLIQPNINGGYDLVCKPYIYNIDEFHSTNVLWKSGSKSERVVTGIAIIEAIKKKLDLPNLPILFDEGGEISRQTFNDRVSTNSQIICVKVKDGINKPIVVSINDLSN